MSNNNTLQTLIDALTILRKYGNPTYPTHCEHDILMICNIDPEIVSVEDTQKLDELGFFISTEYEPHFASFRFGSA